MVEMEKKKIRLSIVVNIGRKHFDNAIVHHAHQLPTMYDRQGRLKASSLAIG